MNHKGNFAAAVSALLRQLNMDIPPEILVGKLYTITTGQVAVELTGTEDGCITLFCFPGALPKLHLESLATLLLANRYQQAHPPILTSLVGQTVPPKVLLWSSLGQAEADGRVSPGRTVYPDGRSSGRHAIVDPPIVYTRGGDTYDQVAFAALNDNKVDVLTVRSGKDTWKSDLIDVLDEIGIRSQYAESYDPSCRWGPPRSGSTTPPEWDPFTDNISDKDEFRFLKRIEKAGGQREVVEVDDTDKDVQEWLEEYSRQTTKPNAQAGVGATLTQNPEQAGGSLSTTEIPIG